MVILSLFDVSLVALRPWVEAGHTCIAVDVQHPPGWTERDGVRCWGGDVRDFDEESACFEVPDLVLAFPPCDHLAASGARWWAAKGPDALAHALNLVRLARRWCGRATIGGFIENPVGRLSTEWRRPDYYFHPWEYAGYDGGSEDRYTKKTGIWICRSAWSGSAGPVMPERRALPVDPATADRIHKAPGWNKAVQKRIRQKTPAGFARAFFEANAR